MRRTESWVGAEKMEQRRAWNIEVWMTSTRIWRKLSVGKFGLHPKYVRATMMWRVLIVLRFHAQQLTKVLFVTMQATIGAIGILTGEPRLYCARPILISGTCKKESAAEHAGVLRTALNATNDMEETTHLRIVSKASDGEKRRGAALAEICCDRPLPPTSPIYPALSDCELMDFLTGEDDITLDKDYKHVFKRLRNNVLRIKGFCVNGISVTPSAVRQHLLDSGLSAAHVHSVFKPNDKQDVLLSYNLLRDLWTLAPAPSSKSSLYVQKREAIRTYGQLCYHLVHPYICVDLSLAEQLEHLSAAAHLALALYDINHEDGNPSDALMPTELYIDIQHMIKNALFCVAKAQVDNPESEFFLVLLGTDRLETLFGILRTMIGNDANLDLLQLSLRLTGTTKAANLFAKYPQWDKGPRRLRLPLVSRDSTTIPEAADHINPRLWRGCVLVMLVTIVTCWKRGRRMVEDRYAFVAPALARVRSNSHATMLAPYGVPLFKIPLADDDGEDEDGDEFSSRHTEALPSSDDNSLDGLRALEDAAVEVDWNNSPVQRTFLKTIEVNGSAVNKSRALAQRFKYHKTTSSADRLRRVAHEGRYKTMPAWMEAEEPTDGPFLSIFDPIASLLVCEAKLFLCVGEVNELWVDSKSSERVPIRLLPESTIRLSYQVLHLIPATIEDDPTEKHDWRSSRFLSSYNFTIPGFLAQPVNPATSVSTSGSPHLLFDSDSLRALASGLRDRLTHAHTQLIPKVKPGHQFPYREAHGTY